MAMFYAALFIEHNHGFGAGSFTSACAHLFDRNMVIHGAQDCGDEIAALIDLGEHIIDVPALG